MFHTNLEITVGKRHVGAHAEGYQHGGGNHSEHLEFTYAVKVSKILSFTALFLSLTVEISVKDSDVSAILVSCLVTLIKPNFLRTFMSFLSWSELFRSPRHAILNYSGPL